MSEFIRPVLYGADHPLSLLAPGDPLDEPLPTVHLAGPVCEAGDTLAHDIGRWLPPDQLRLTGTGALIGIGQAGAYGAAMASVYNGRLRAAEVVIDHGEARPEPPPRDGGRRVQPRRRRLRPRPRRRGRPPSRGHDHGPVPEPVAAGGDGRVRGPRPPGWLHGPGAPGLSHRHRPHVGPPPRLPALVALGGPWRADHRERVSLHVPGRGWRGGDAGGNASDPAPRRPGRPSPVRGAASWG